jgi:LacI family transcriptional regulator
LGHRRIGFINGHPNQTATGQRFRGYVEGMTEAGLSVGTDQVAQGYFTYRSGWTRRKSCWKTTIHRHLRFE